MAVIGTATWIFGKKDRFWSNFAGRYVPKWSNCCRPIFGKKDRFWSNFAGRCVPKWSNCCRPIFGKKDRFLSNFVDRYGPFWLTYCRPMWTVLNRKKSYNLESTVQRSEQVISAFCVVQVVLIIRSSSWREFKWSINVFQ